MPTLTDRCRQLRMSATDCGDEERWGALMRKWRVTLRYQGRSMSVDFWQGSAHGNKRPDKADVMDCLLSDASTLDEEPDYGSWADSLGLHPDRRDTEQTYQVTVRQTTRLRRLLGDEYDAWMYETENDR